MIILNRHSFEVKSNKNSNDNKSSDNQKAESKNEPQSK